MVKATEEVTPSAGHDVSNSLQGSSSQVPASAVTGTSTAAPSTGAAPVTRPGYAHLFKYIVVGDTYSGKTSLVRRFCSDTFTETQIVTSGVDFDIKTLSTPNGDQIKLQIWDTAGQERFRTITSSYYRGAHGIVIVYDVTDKATYDNVFLWMKEVQRYCNESAKIIIVGNKMDLWDGNAEFYGKEKFAEKFGLDDPEDPESWIGYGIAGFYQASAKTGEGVARAFQDLTEILVAERLDAKNPLRAAGLKGRAGGAGGTGKRKSSGGTSGNDMHDGYNTQINYRKMVRVQSSGCCTVL